VSKNGRSLLNIFGMKTVIYCIEKEGINDSRLYLKE
jgi:hypothetical protein